MTSSGRVTRLAYALILPFVVHGPLIVLAREMQATMPSLAVVVGYLSPILAVVLGFSFIGQQLTRRQVIVTGFWYLSIMLAALTYFTAMVIGSLYSDWP